MTAASEGEGRQPEEERVIIRDKRRIDPDTGAVREPAGATASPAPGAQAPPDSGAPAEPALEPDAAVEEPDTRVAELTADLQRVSAEYANYRRRVERDRLVAGEQATGTALAALLPVLDDIGRAREHGDLEGAFRAVGEAVEAACAKLGLVPFGEVGEPFDPTLHEALMQSESAEVAEPSVAQVFSPGYRLGERVLRPARVGVALPADVSADTGTSDRSADEAVGIPTDDQAQ